MHDEAVHVSLTSEEKRQLRSIAGERDQSMSEFGREILTEWLDEHVEESLEN